MPRLRPHLTYANVVATLCLAGLVGGTTLAATSGTSSKTISICVRKSGAKKGTLRVASKCRRSERKLSWNRAGRVGPAGPAGAAGADAVAPAGAVGFFALSACPAGWDAYAPAQGRYVVGLPTGGTLEGTDGTALTDKEDRPVGQHTHTVDDPGHTHDVEVDPILDGGNVVAQRVTGTADTQSGFVKQTVSAKALKAFTGITIANAGLVAGTNAPYVQLLACKKS